jgi:hypothetical protein
MAGADGKEVSGEALLALYEQVSEELARLRQSEWTTGYYFASVAGGLIFLSAQDNYEELVARWVCGLLVMFQLFCVILWGYYLHRDHRYLTEHRRLRGKIEDKLGYYGLRDDQNKPIIPQSWHRGDVTYRFQFSSVVAPLAVGVAGIQIFSIYMVGRPLWPMLCCGAP